MSPVREFIISTTEHYYNVPQLKFDEKVEEVLSDFIHNSQTLLLQGIAYGNALLLHTKICHDKNKSIVFYKSSAQDLVKEDAVKDINIVTLSSSVAGSLYQVLKHIYSPLLTGEDDLYSNKLQKNLSELESNLRILTHGKGEDSNNVILSIEDEVEYWKIIVEKKNSSKEREGAATMCELFEDIGDEISSLQSIPMSDIRETVENIGGILDDVWRSSVISYPQERMIHIFDVIGHVICTTIHTFCSNMVLWKVHDGPKENEILSLLSDSVAVIQTWISACQSLTGTYWPNYALHAWSGKPYVPPFCLNFQVRVKEIYEIKSTYCQLNKLLTNAEKQELKTYQLFEHFENINVWMCNGPNQVWQSAVAKFSQALRPAEIKIAEKLKPRLHNTSTKQMLYEFMRYKSLLERPLVKHALANELEIFVSSLLSMLKTIQGQLEADEVDVRMYQPPEMSLTVQQVQWAKQMEAKVKDIQVCAEKYLKEFEGSAELSRLAAQVLKDLKTMYTQLHEEWSRDLQAQVKSGSLKLCMDKPVVEFSPSSRMMVVNFSPRLVWAELEARALAALGLPPPAAAAKLDALGNSLVHARALHQVASFHNTLGERMIPSTRPMMLQAALDLSTLVQDQKAVYWDDTEQLANYTDKLKNIVLKLETQNTYLTSQHMAIRNIVEKLMDTELLAQQSEWKKQINDIRDIIEKVESNGYKNTDAWRSHWDWQIYKALECQYIKTLLSLHKHFPHVKVDLVLRGHSVRVSPALEEVRVQHYHQLRRLAALPAHVAPLRAQQGDRNLFADIVDKHSWLGNKAVQQLEAALSALQRACENWSRRAALACLPDLHALCLDQLKEPHDWEINFKACKAYSQAVAKMSFEDEKIEWISVGTGLLRREMETAARSLWAALLASLQNSCRANAASLGTAAAAARLLLDAKPLPKNAKELADVSAQHRALQASVPEMEKTVEELKRKGHLLRTWGGDAAVGDAVREWQETRELMLNQQHLFEHQAEVVKSSLTNDWENLNNSMEAWTSRWEQSRSQLQARAAHYDEMTERCRSVFEAHEHWLKLVVDRDQLMEECKKFDMNIEPPPIWKEAEKLMDEYVTLWTPLKHYSEEFDSMADQEWILFQKKLHLLDEFVSKWSSQLEPFTTVTLFIQQELEKFADLTPLLKYLRGVDYTECHWREVFALLDVEYKKPDAILVRDLLNAAPNIKKHVKALQKISVSASSEAAVRSALSELEVWFAGARFGLVPASARAPPVHVVKDFKYVLAKIEEQQWVVSSVSAGGAWEARLRTAAQLTRAAHHAQRRWLYLEPILCNDDGELGAKFRKVDQGFRQVARIFETDPRLSALLQSSRLQSMLDSISEQLLSCQSELNQYIDEKRSVFPRLYFLSDDDLLELLGQARAGAEGREVVMQNHLKKLFPGITGVRLGPGGMSITALCSQYDEVFQLDHPVDIDCSVEVWLKNLESEMRSSLKNLTLKCVVTKSIQEQDPFTMPTQILCLAQNIRFTEQAERAIASKELHKLKGNVEKENLYYAAADVDDESERHKRQALILQCAYYMSVIQTLIENNVAATSDWLWQKQLRFYLLSDKVVVAKMGLAQISYSYEYLGINTGQFARTELADECFLILTQSLHLGFVGNPFGPAGTGKTESVKALGGLVGRLVLIFNCDEAMDTECMGRLLTGLALCGAWGCFDEFNRLSADTLADVSHQLSALLPAMKSSAAGNPATAVLNGKQVSVSAWCGVAATLNPVGRGYLGRRALAPGLQRALRPVAMAHPRPQPLAAQLLAARALPQPDALAHLLCDVFSLASELLSGQRHYDWGLRALKAAVSSCGNALAARPRAEHAERARLTRRLLALNNMSKLTAHDALRFQGILSLVFGEESEDASPADSFRQALEASVDTLGYTRNNLQIQKCMELYEQVKQRMGVAIVGPPGTGKTTIRQVLKNALTREGETIVEYVISPKAMSREKLLGHVDHDTRQWADGVISATALEICNQAQGVWSWVVLDGEVEPEWVEALNSVLDDNRLLTLASGARLQFPARVNFLFEAAHLKHASPATISRLGIVLLSDENCCAEETLQSWVRKQEFDEEATRMALPMLQEVIRKSLSWFNAHKSDVTVKICNTTMVKQMATQFVYAAQNTSNMAHTTPDELVLLAVQRSVMGLLKDNAVDGFYEEVCASLGGAIAAAGLPSGDHASLPPRLAAGEPALRAGLNADQHLLVVGPSACGKNILIEHVLKDIDCVVINVNCTPITEPSDIIAELKRSNVARGGGGGAAGGGRALLVLRALHRARRDSWGCSALLQFLLQLIQHGGFWSVGGTEAGSVSWWRARVRLVAVAATPPPDARLASALALITLPEPDDAELMELVRSSLSCDKNIAEKEISTLVSSIVLMFREITETFTSRPHYKWNASHLTRWCENVKWYSPSSLSELLVGLNAEANFIFRDRLVTEDERSRFNLISRSHLKGNTTDKIYFTPKLRTDGVYMEMVEPKDWYQRTQKIINQCLTENEYAFGETGAEVCSELSVLCSAMARVICGGTASCVSAAGAGRRAAALLVAAALPATLYEVENPQQFNLQFKNALTSAGEGTRTLVLVCEWAATACNLANVEALRGADSLYAIPSQLLPSQHTPHTLNNIKQNLGIVICLDKNQENLWDLMEKFPLLYNSGHMVWLDGWSADTLQEMPSLVVNRLMKEDISQNKEQTDPVPVDGFLCIYNSIESEVMRAPRRYVHFIKTYYRIMSKKKAYLLQRQSLLTAGVEALRNARASVAVLQTEAAEQRVQFEQRQADANHALEQIGATVRCTTDRREEMHALKQSIEAENDKLQIRKKEIEAELSSVEPIIEAARAAVGDIRPESLSEVRSLRAPPDVVRDILEGVLRLMGISDTSWHSMKNFLSKRGVKEDIRCLDASTIKPEAAEAVRRLLERRGASFEAVAAKRASAACAPLAAWVRANLAYAEALGRVRPLQLQQRQLHQNLSDAEAQLSALSMGLSGVEARVSALQAELGAHSRDAAQLEVKLRAADETIRAAHDLLDRLADEFRAWETHLEYISIEIAELSPRSLLAAGYVVYLPHLTEPQAREYINKWSTLIGFDDSSFSVLNFLSSTEKQLKWEADGLPSDQSALKNAVLIDQALESPKCGLTPLIVDPDGDALQWLQRTLADTPCDFVSQNSDKLHTAVQYAARLGRALVITDVEGVHESWAALSGNNRLVLQSRDSRVLAALPPRLAAATAAIHFAARLDPLTDQLVYHALQQQNPELNDKFKEVKLQKATLQKQQHELQETLLKELSTKSDILHDANLLESLRRMRETSATIAASLAAAQELESARDAAHASLAPSARLAARLALAVRALAAKRPLLTLPFEPVAAVYANAVRNHASKNSNTINSDEVVKYTTRRIIERVLLALHKKDKYIVVLHLLKQVYEDEIPDKLYQLLIGNYSVVDDQDIINEIKKKHSWLSDESVKKVAQIKATSEELYNKLCLEDEALWREFVSCGALPALERLRLGALETAAAVAALRPDSRYRALVALTDHFLGAGAARSVDEVPCAARCSSPRRPLLVLAAHALDVLAAHAASLTQVGVGDGLTAWEERIESTRRGGWLALVVGASPFPKDLHHFLRNLAMRPADDFSDDFRLWIVSEDRDVPTQISNMCINVILEPPEGVKANVLSTLSAWGPYSGEPLVVRMHALLALFHARVQERRAYIPQGWSAWYEWEWGEVLASARVLRGGVSTSAARALLCALYAARVPAKADRALLAALARTALADKALAHGWRPPGLPERAPPPPLANDLQAYVSTFDALPDIDTPQLLGLPANCRVAWERTAADDIINGLKDLDSSVESNREDSSGLTPLKTLLALWKKLMSGNPLIKENYEIKENARGWWGAVAMGEARDAARLTRTLHAALSRAYSDKRRDVAMQVPEEWQLLWAGPAAPLAYVREFCHRARRAVARLDGAHGHAAPKEVDLRDFLRPSRLISALHANAASRLRVAPHSLVLTAKWDAVTGDIAAEQEGTIVTGVRLCGGAWSGGALLAAPAHAPPHRAAPPILLRYVPQSGPQPVEEARSLRVPLYASEAREALVCEARAPLHADFPRDVALLHAVALFVAPIQ